MTWASPHDFNVDPWNAVEPEPLSACPQCKREQPDPDGIGVQFCEDCGYCTHASSVAAPGVCDACDQDIVP